MKNYLVAMAVAMFICFAIVSATLSVMNTRINEYQMEVSLCIIDLYKEVQKVNDNSVDMKGFIDFVEAHR